jgi:hypothetical protein
MRCIYVFGILSNINFNNIDDNFIVEFFFLYND